MSARYEAEWRARFGDETGVPGDVPEVPWLRQVLLRRTHRRYADRPVAEPLLRLLLGLHSQPPRNRISSKPR